MPGINIYLAVVPLIGFNVVEWHQPDRVMRQFGLQQHIPSPPLQDPLLHELDGRKNIDGDWARYYNIFIQRWQHRRDFVISGSVDNSSGSLDYASDYMAWYRSITRRWITKSGAKWVLEGDELRKCVGGSLSSSEAPYIFAIPQWVPPDSRYNRARHGEAVCNEVEDEDDGDADEDDGDAEIDEEESEGHMVNEEQPSSSRSPPQQLENHPFWLRTCRLPPPAQRSGHPLPLAPHATSWKPPPVYQFAWEERPLVHSPTEPWRTASFTPTSLQRPGEEGCHQSQEEASRIAQQPSHASSLADHSHPKDPSNQTADCEQGALPWNLRRNTQRDYKYFSGSRYYFH